MWTGASTHFRHWGIVSAASNCNAIDLFYDGTNHTINYVDENDAL